MEIKSNLKIVPKISHGYKLARQGTNLAENKIYK